MELSDVKVECFNCDSKNVEIVESKAYCVRCTDAQRSELQRKYLLVNVTCAHCGFVTCELYDRATGENVGDKVNEPLDDSKVHFSEFTHPSEM